MCEQLDSLGLEYELTRRGAIRATIKGLQAMQSPESVAAKRGKSVDEIMANVG